MLNLSDIVQCPDTLCALICFYPKLNKQKKIFYREVIPAFVWTTSTIAMVWRTAHGMVKMNQMDAVRHFAFHFFVNSTMGRKSLMAEWLEQASQ